MYILYKHLKLLAIAYIFLNLFAANKLVLVKSNFQDDWFWNFNKNKSVEFVSAQFPFHLFNIIIFVKQTNMEIDDRNYNNLYQWKSSL